MTTSYHLPKMRVTLKGTRISFLRDAFFEVSYNEKLTFKEKPTVMVKEIQEEVNWEDYMDVEAMKAMLKVGGQG